MNILKNPQCLLVALVCVDTKASLDYTPFSQKEVPAPRYAEITLAANRDPLGVFLCPEVLPVIESSQAVEFLF